jgi:dTDP-glucose 4,6-dehydratase
MEKNILITGGAGFIGSHLIRLFVNKYPQYNIYNLDSLSYAGNISNLSDVANNPNYHFLKENITNYERINCLFDRFDITDVIHLAAESHVDRSIDNPLLFAETNVMGTLNLLNAAKEAWAENHSNSVFYQISTDEVYGTLNDEGLFREDSPYDPRSPYSASKAAADHFTRAYSHTYNMPVVISNCSNNYGPYQFPEKLIPLVIKNIIDNKDLPVYGDGQNIRDWLYVEDHASAIDEIFHNGQAGETYNIGSNNEWKNIDLIEMLIDIVDPLLGREGGSSRKLIKYVSDRPGHDFRYAIDANKLMNNLNWSPSVDFKKGLEVTAEWYVNNTKWIKNIISGEYLDDNKNA